MCLLHSQTDEVKVSEIQITKMTVKEVAFSFVLSFFFLLFPKPVIFRCVQQRLGRPDEPHPSFSSSLFCMCHHQLTIGVLHAAAAAPPPPSSHLALAEPLSTLCTA